MATELVVHSLDELERQRAPSRLAGGALQGEEVADGEGVGPEVAAALGVALQARALGEVVHQLAGSREALVIGHGVFLQLCPGWRGSGSTLGRRSRLGSGLVGFVLVTGGPQRARGGQRQRGEREPRATPIHEREHDPQVALQRRDARVEKTRATPLARTERMVSLGS